MRRLTIGLALVTTIVLLVTMFRIKSLSRRITSVLTTHKQFSRHFVAESKDLHTQMKQIDLVGGGADVGGEKMTKASVMADMAELSDQFQELQQRSQRHPDTNPELAVEAAVAKGAAKVAEEAAVAKEVKGAAAAKVAEGAATATDSHATAEKGVASAPYAVEISTTHVVTQPGFTATVLIDDKAGTVLKTVHTNFLQWGVVSREVCVLQLLQRFAWCPRLLSFTNTSLMTQLSGKPINSTNIPDDYMYQISQILSDMQSVGIRHNDLFKVQGKTNQPQIEIVVGTDGKMSVVDFSWSSVHGRYSCRKDVPEQLHPDFRPFLDVEVIGLLDSLFQKKQAHIDSKITVDDNLSTRSNGEFHIFIIWDAAKGKAFKKMQHILHTVSPSLKVAAIEVHAAIEAKLHPNVLHKFDMRYFSNGTIIPHPDPKYCWECDNRMMKSFLVFYVYDTNPVYKYRMTTHGPMLVNKHMFDYKQAVRASDVLNGGSSIFHATDDTVEFTQNIACLGHSSKMIAAKLKKNMDEEVLLGWPGSVAWCSPETCDDTLPNLPSAKGMDKARCAMFLSADCHKALIGLGMRVPLRFQDHDYGGPRASTAGACLERRLSWQKHNQTACSAMTSLFRGAGNRMTEDLGTGFNLSVAINEQHLSTGEGLFPGIGYKRV